mgnify:FL=1
MIPQRSEIVPQHPEMFPQPTEMIKQHCGTISADDYSNNTLIITKFYIKIIF